MIWVKICKIKEIDTESYCFCRKTDIIDTKIHITMGKIHQDVYDDRYIYHKPVLSLEKDQIENMKLISELTPEEIKEINEQIEKESMCDKL
jgi:hypothetical protein